jgi:hypothetical protein
MDPSTRRRGASWISDASVGFSTLGCVHAQFPAIIIDFT